MPQANAFWGYAAKIPSAIAKISKSTKALPDDEIIRLSKLSREVKGTTKVGEELGKLNLPNDVLEDTFMRIAIYQKKVTRKDAEGMYFRLSGTPGFRSTLRKIIGNNDMGATGHLNELRIADTASMYGFKVVGIGEKFTDGFKKATTDIDIVLEKGGKTFAIEAKSYAPTTRMPLDRFRADLDTLAAYKSMNREKVIPIFTITNRPNDSQYIELLKYEAAKRDIQLIFGSPEEQLVQIQMLDKIL